MISHVLPTYNRAPIAFERGEGTWAIATDGTRYLDLGAGIAVNALGHANPELVATLTEQANRIWHVSNLYQIPEQERLADLLVESLNLDGVSAAEIDPEAPLFGAGLGLDSIDALELSLAISKKYGFQLRSDNDDNRRIFGSLRALSAHIESQRTV